MMGDPRFVAAFSHLAPAVIRVGGITADWALYTGFGPTDQRNDVEAVAEAGRDDSNSTARARQGQLVKGYWPTSEFNLTFATFMKLHDFAGATGLSLMFDLNELHGLSPT